MLFFFFLQRVGNSDLHGQQQTLDIILLSSDPGSVDTQAPLLEVNSAGLDFYLGNSDFAPCGLDPKPTEANGRTPINWGQACSQVY